MEHNCITLNTYHTDYLEQVGNLPLYTSGGKRVININKGRIFPQGCMHESLRFAEKCCHNSYEWDNADEVLIIEESGRF